MAEYDKVQKVHWQAEAYDESMSFVSSYGKGVMDWLNPREGELIVDFGCGTGDLAAQIAASGAQVLGVDISPEMVERARIKYPKLKFQCADGMNWKPERGYDAVFSNAALHWMKDAEAAIESMTSSLKPGGRLVVEFGGYRNVAAIVEAVKRTLTVVGREDAFVMPWYFPKVGEYASLLERSGMEVRTALLFDRPTRLEKGEEGMMEWLRMFGTAMFPYASAQESVLWMGMAVERLKEKLFDRGGWTADYRRLRVIAVKTNDEVQQNGI